MKKILFGLIAPVLSMASILTMPMQAAAESCCPPPCCDPCEDDCCDNGWMEKLGLVLVAAGAGALAGWGAAEATKGGGHHHHHRDCDVCPTGPTGPSSFTTTSDTLTFVLGGTAALGGGSIGLLSVGDVGVFVSTPDGDVISVNTNAVVTGFTGDLFIPNQTITVNNAVLGTYHYGFVFPAGTIFGGDSTLGGTVATSRNELYDNVTDLSVPSLFGSFADEVQTTGEFTYGSSTGPVFP